MFLRSRPKKPDGWHFRTDHLKANLGSNTARGSLITLTWHGVKFVIGIGATAIMARMLRTEEYGLIGMVAVITLYISIFKDIGLTLVTVQKSEISYKQVSN